MRPLPDGYRRLPLRDRLFVRARRKTAPLDLIADRAPRGDVLDIGCGHGLLAMLLAERDQTRRVVGIDTDARKIAHARLAAQTQENLDFQVATIEAFAAANPRQFDAAVIADVLYLLPLESWVGFLKTVHATLRRGGRLLLKEAENDNSWRYWKCLLQESVMVHVVRKTRHSGALGFQPRAATEQALREAGFRVDTVADVSRGYSTPHVLFEATAA